VGVGQCLGSKIHFMSCTAVYANVLKNQNHSKHHKDVISSKTLVSNLVMSECRKFELFCYFEMLVCGFKQSLVQLKLKQSGAVQKSVPLRKNGFTVLLRAKATLKVKTLPFGEL
jgi:hypothetical protein